MHAPWLGSCRQRVSGLRALTSHLPFSPGQHAATGADITTFTSSDGVAWVLKGKFGGTRLTPGGAISESGTYASWQCGPVNGSYVALIDITTTAADGTGEKGRIGAGRQRAQGSTAVCAPIPLYPHGALHLPARLPLQWAPRCGSASLEFMIPLASSTPGRAPTAPAPPRPPTRASS